MSFEVELNSNLVCAVCQGTGSLLKIENGKRKFLDCICFGGCLYPLVS